MEVEEEDNLWALGVATKEPREDVAVNVDAIIHLSNWKINTTVT